MKDIPVHTLTEWLFIFCSGLATVINQADIDIDGNPTEEKMEFGKKAKAGAEQKFREFTVGLLNQAARKEIDPIQGLGLFMDKLQSMVNQELEKAKDDDKKAIKKAIFEAWKNDLEELVRDYEGNYRYFIARQLGIRIPVQDRETINLQEIVFPRHFRILKRKNLYQSQLLARIDSLKAKIVEDAGKKPKNFDKAFKYALMKRASVDSPETRNVFQRLYNCSGTSLETLERECTKPALRLVSEEKIQKEIDLILKESSKFVRNFSIDEVRFSSDLMRQIRTMKKLSLRTFAAKYNKTYPKEKRPLNYEQLRRIELGCVKPTTRVVKQFASLLNVHESVLLPELNF